MDIVVKGYGDQTFSIPVYDDSAIKAVLADHEARLKKLESGVAPTPIPSGPKFYAETSVYYAGVAKLPKSSQSAALVSELVRNVNLPGGGFLTCGTNSNGLWEADAATPLQTVRRIKNGVTTPFQVRIPSNFAPAKLPSNGYGDAHGCIVDRVAGTITDMWAMAKDSKGWTCKDRGITKIGGDGILRDSDMGGDWNSATASHIPLSIRPITKKELEDYAAGKITSAGHMLGLAIQQPAKYPGFKAPAQSNSDGNNSSPSAIKYGQVFRFPSSYVPPTSHPVLLRLIADTLKSHGAVVMDVTGAGATFYAQDPQQFGLSELDMLRPYVGSYIENNSWIQWYKLFGDSNNVSLFEWPKLEAVE